MRGTSRREEGLEEIDRSGLEPAMADPDRPGTILELCRDVAVVVWLLGSASGEEKSIRAIHGPRLERLLERLVDTPVRSFVYESAGSVDPVDLDGGRRIVLDASDRWRIPVAFIGDAAGRVGWAEQAAASVSGSLAA